MGRRKTKAVPNLITPASRLKLMKMFAKDATLVLKPVRWMCSCRIPQKGTRLLSCTDECWYCGCCVKDCPLREKGAIKMNWPLMLKMRWKDKERESISGLGCPTTTFKSQASSGRWDIIVEKRDTEYWNEDHQFSREYDRKKTSV